MDVVYICAFFLGKFDIFALYLNFEQYQSWAILDHIPQNSKSSSSIYKWIIHVTRSYQLI